MALLSAILRLGAAERDNLTKIANAAQAQAAAVQAQTAIFQAMLDKLNEPDPDGGDSGVTQEMIDDWAAALKASNDKLAAAGQPPVPAPTGRR